jgi:hypothetical protein
MNGLVTFKADSSLEAVGLDSVSSSQTSYILCANGSFYGVKRPGA